MNYFMRVKLYIIFVFVLNLFHITISYNNNQIHFRGKYAKTSQRNFSMYFTSFDKANRSISDLIFDHVIL